MERAEEGGRKTKPQPPSGVLGELRVLRGRGSPSEPRPGCGPTFLLQARKVEHKLRTVTVGPALGVTRHYFCRATEKPVLGTLPKEGAVK